MTKISKFILSETRHTLFVIVLSWRTTMIIIHFVIWFIVAYIVLINVILLFAFVSIQFIVGKIRTSRE